MDNYNEDNIKLLLSSHLSNDITNIPLKTSEKIADKVTNFLGSWKYIIVSNAFICVWMLLQTFILHNKGSDPYPYILLNFILSYAASQGQPILQLSQNRSSEEDRRHQRADALVNLKTEILIEELHKKQDEQNAMLKKILSLLENEKS